MKVTELKNFVLNNVHTFDHLKIIKNGVAYHYTSYYDKIEKAGRFLGAPIDKNLDQTQLTIPSKQATCTPGVVFAYLDKKDAEEEGFDCDIIEIEFCNALQATHVQEVTLGAPDTILIINTDIKKFKKITNTNK